MEEYCINFMPNWPKIGSFSPLGLLFSHVSDTFSRRNSLLCNNSRSWCPPASYWSVYFNIFEQRYLLTLINMLFYYENLQRIIQPMLWNFSPEQFSHKVNFCLLSSITALLTQPYFPPVPCVGKQAICTCRCVPVEAISLRLKFTVMFKFCSYSKCCSHF